MKPEKLVMMANQIGAFFSSQKGDVAVQGIADHLKKFWDPRMRESDRARGGVPKVKHGTDHDRSYHHISISKSGRVDPAPDDAEARR